MIDDIVPVSDSVVAVTLKAKPKPLTLIQVYAPTGDSEDE